MTGPGSTNAVVATLRAGQLDQGHHGLMVHVHTSPPVFGRLDQVERPEPGQRTLTLSGRPLTIPSACPVQVITKEATA